MINFTVGPVQAGNSVLELGSKQVPYFRTAEFSSVMLENERLLLELLSAPDGSRAVFLTGSGTAAMEASVMGVLDRADRAIVIDGGTFGRRFCELCNLHGITYDRVALEAGRALTEADLLPYEGDAHTVLLVNQCETSTGTLYDMRLITDFCRRNRLLLIVDAISSFLADPLDMAESGVDVAIAGSQKALACPPGISMLALSPKALDRVRSNPAKCMYLDLKAALADGERGQTPFTPAVGTLLQLNVRLREVVQNGGATLEVENVERLAAYFRESISNMRLRLLSEAPSNAVTALYTERGRAEEAFTILKDEFDIWVCPNGGAQRSRLPGRAHRGPREGGFRLSGGGACRPPGKRRYLASSAGLRAPHMCYRRPA